MKLTIRLKIMTLGTVMVVLTIILLGGSIAWLVHSKAQNDLSDFETKTIALKQQELRNVMNIAFSALKAAYGDTGVINGLRYGSDRSNYFWVHSYTPSQPEQVEMLMTPALPHLEGKPLAAYRDGSESSRGEMLMALDISEPTPAFVHMNRLIDRQGEGFVRYQWPQLTPEGLTEPRLKLGYVRLYEDLGLVIGTGVYLDDVMAEIARQQEAIQQQLESILWVVLVISGLVLCTGIVSILFVSNLITHPIHENILFLKQIAQGHGDLTKRLATTSRDETAELVRWFNAFIVQIQRIVQTIANSAGSMHQHSMSLNESIDSVSHTMHDLAQLASSQAQAVHETSSAMHEINSAVEMTAQYAKHADQFSQEASHESHLGSEAVQQMQQSMARIWEASLEVNNFISAIHRIANKTNLLSLNAAIEAAKAGDQGRGFAVVADEVRNLAVNSAQVTHEIQSLIEENNSRIQEGQSAVELVEQSLHRISEKVSQSSSLVAQISTATTEQTLSIHEMNISLEGLAENSSKISEASTTIDQRTQEQLVVAHETSQEADHLSEQIAKFKY